MKTIIGIDWSEKKHCVHAYNEAGAKLLRLEVAATVTGFRELTQQVNKLSPEPVDCLVAIEAAHNLLVDYLQDLGYTLYILAPSLVSSNRDRQGSSGAKDDDRDAQLLAEILRTDLGRLIPWQPDGPLVRQMRILLTAVDQLTKSIVRRRNLLRAHLLRFYPQAKALFANPLGLLHTTTKQVTGVCPTAMLIAVLPIVGCTLSGRCGSGAKHMMKPTTSVR